KSLVRLSVRPLTDEVLRALREVNMLHTLRWAGSGSEKPPASAAEVRYFHVYSPLVTTEGLKELTCFTNLEILNLDQSGLTDAALKELGAFKSLRKLMLNNKMTDAGLKDLAGLKFLEILDLQNTKVTPAGLKALAGLKLHTLELRSEQVTD